jgi:hypothetical protein
MAQHLAEEDFQRWKRGIDQSSGDPEWDQYDCVIQETVFAFNRHLSGTPRYKSLDWKLIKAMIWVESGANSPDWKSNPMQMGKFGDPGLDDLLAPAKGGEIILTPGMRAGLTPFGVRNDPLQNIRAGIGYLLMRAARFDWVQRVDARDAYSHEYVVRPGDSLDRIARQHGTTVEVLRDMNMLSGVLQPGQRLKYRKASREKMIVDWRSLNFASIAALYNGPGDNTYERKLAYAMTALVKKEGRQCNG